MKWLAYAGTLANGIVGFFLLLLAQVGARRGHLLDDSAGLLLTSVVVAGCAVVWLIIGALERQNDRLRKDLARQARTNAQLRAVLRATEEALRDARWALRRRHPPA